MNLTLSVDTNVLFGIVSGKPPKKSSRKRNSTFHGLNSHERCSRAQTRQSSQEWSDCQKPLRFVPEGLSTFQTHVPGPFKSYELLA
jgi:hypothetical protein